jgi:DNA-binding MarR family transcriptional regulator
MDTAPIELDRYVVDTLLPDLVGHDHHPSAFLVYLALAGAAGGGSVALSYSQLAERTGLSKRAVQTAVARLQRRALIEVQGRNVTEPLRYRVLTPWRPVRGSA